MRPSAIDGHLLEAIRKSDPECAVALERLAAHVANAPEGLPVSGIDHDLWRFASRFFAGVRGLDDAAAGLLAVRLRAIGEQLHRDLRGRVDALVDLLDASLAAPNREPSGARDRFKAGPETSVPVAFFKPGAGEYGLVEDFGCAFFSAATAGRAQPDPAMWERLETPAEPDEGVECAVETAWRAALALHGKPCPQGVLWRLRGADGASNRETLNGGSLGGAAARAFWHLLRSEKPDPEVLVVAGIEPDGRLKRVQAASFSGKIERACRDRRIDTIVVHPHDLETARRALERVGETAKPIHITTAEAL